MKTLPYYLTLVGLTTLLLTACDQPETTQTSNEAALQEGVNALQTNGSVAPQASTERQLSGSADAASVSSRSLLENIASNDDLSTFNEMLKKAGIAKNLRGTGPYTVLAPSQAAFQALPDSLRDHLESAENRDLLQQLLNNHIIAGKLTTSDLQDGAILKTVAGHQLKVAKHNDKVQIGNALIEDPDVMCGNGVLHVVNRVLVPVKETAL
ncbi:fasciclin domain-containing protein [Pontibacter ramchanderi]|uniref:Putative surface protein with fasciclin (FAS1) repeats n=1 Tax=Pontibacter ramchanderi TaxID=1179743 RepID=A0A2N3UAQ8_9BACT|nr:fasciclin domain-containing protein [Pontibacter ramchanderi]PKV66448.1 putative surface protein with fasciclin (FAS1) repeats [Pontibacter ramchanderi]